MPFKAILICSSPQEREALVAQLASVRGVDINVHVGNARTLSILMQKERPDLVLLDLPAPNEQAFEHIETAILRVPGTLVLLVSPEPTLTILKRAMRAGVRDVLPSPLGPATVQQAVDFARQSQSLSSRLNNNEGRLLAFMPVKGGSGCTFLASNLGYTLAAGGKKVLLVDLDLHLGDMAGYITDRQPTASILDLARQSHRLDGALLESSVLKVNKNLHLLAAPTQPAQTNELPPHNDELTPEALENILSLARSEYDFVILDVSNELVPASTRALELSDQIWLILQLTLPAVQEAKNMTTVFQQMGFAQDKLGLVVNRYERQGVLRLEEVERVLKAKVARTIPSSYNAVTASINQATPLPALFPRDIVSRGLQEWANELSPVTVKPAQGWLSKFMGGLRA